MNRGYLGKPENQRNPRAKNLFTPKQTQDATQAEPSAAPRNASAAPKQPAPAARPPKGMKSHIPTPSAAKVAAYEKAPDTGSFFTFNITVRERNPHLAFTPSLATYPNLVTQVFSQMLIDDNTLTKEWTLEMFQYYAVFLLWLRIIHLKEKFRQDLSDQEESLIRKCDNYAFNIPEPISIYLNSLGKIETRAGKHLIPEFPPLPVHIHDHTPGFHDDAVIGQDNHTLYEEIPTPGVVITLLKASNANARPIPQPAIPIVPQGYEANQNLCFWHNIKAPRQEALQILTTCGVDEEHFPCSPPATGFNFNIMKSISAIVAQIETFKIISVSFNTLQEQGSPAQVLPTHPTGDNDITARATTAVVTPTSVNLEDNGIFGMATAYGYQLYKESFENQAFTWCCLTPQDDQVIPQAWTDNRNERRNLPPHYNVDDFSGLTNDMHDYLVQSIENMCKSKR